VTAFSTSTGVDGITAPTCLKLREDFTLRQTPFIREVTDSDMIFLFNRDIAFSERVKYFKALLKEPSKVDLVKELPTVMTDVVKLDGNVMTYIKIKYILCVLYNFIPELQVVISKAFESFETLDLSKDDNVVYMLKEVESIIRLNTSYSVVWSACLKVFSTVEGLGFDYFTSRLTASE
jgi:hypothetical protein